MLVTISVTVLMPAHVSLNFAITQLPRNLRVRDRMLREAPEIFPSAVQRESLTIITFIYDLPPPSAARRDDWRTFASAPRIDSLVSTNLPKCN